MRAFVSATTICIVSGWATKVGAHPPLQVEHADGGAIHLMCGSGEASNGPCPPESDMCTAARDDCLYHEPRPEGTTAWFCWSRQTAICCDDEDDSGCPVIEGLRASCVTLEDAPDSGVQLSEQGVSVCVYDRIRADGGTPCARKATQPTYALQCHRSPDGGAFVRSDRGDCNEDGTRNDLDPTPCKTIETGDPDASMPDASRDASAMDGSVDIEGEPTATYTGGGGSQCRAGDSTSRSRPGSWFVGVLIAVALRNSRCGRQRRRAGNRRAAVRSSSRGRERQKPT